MLINPKYKAKYEVGRFYHINNKALPSKNLFFNEDDYLFFLQTFDKYLSDVFHVYAWCLLPNHFHFLVSVKENIELENTHQEITKKIKNFFLSYSLSIKHKKMIEHQIFAPRYKHILVEDNAYLSSLIIYIHINPYHHQINNDWEHYKWSSYQRICNLAASKLEVNWVLNWFNGLEAFRNTHQENIKEYQEDNLLFID